MSDLTTFTVVPNGPLMCKGSVFIGEDEHTEVYLCRCGKSAKKPFCDGSHDGVFTHDAALERAEGIDEDLTSSILEVKAMPNGPLVVRGPFKVANADGTVVATATRGALCRCGASENKPYCDGAHKGCGFTAE